MSAVAAAERRRISPGTVAVGAAVAVAYAAAAELGFKVAFIAEQVTTVWPPTGIALAALLLGGLRFWPAIWIGAFVTNAGTDAPLWTAFLLATGNTLEGVLATWLLRRRSSPRPATCGRGATGFTPPFSSVAHWAWRISSSAR